MNGMYIYDIKNPASPTFISVYQHVTACDPVVAQGNYAYVTLRSIPTNNWCNRGVNRLDIINISNPYSPQIANTYPMTQPGGLGVKDNYLFVCDKGLKVYRDSATYLTLLKTYPIDAYDVIPLDSLLVAVASDGLYQYKFTPDTVIQMSLIPFGRLF
jgi:hypothetical protein